MKKGIIISNKRPTLIERYCISLTKLAQACTPSMKMLSESAVNFMEGISNMKEFDLEKAKAGAPVCTREGKPARIICWDAKTMYKGEEYPIVALIGDGLQEVETYNNSGHLYNQEKGNEDLMMATTKHEGWINVYRPFNEGKYIVLDVAYETESEAKEAVLNKKMTYITTIKIEWEE